MSRNLRIAALASLAVLALIVTALGIAYRSLRQVRPFYEQALRLDKETLSHASRELESRATALYSDTQQAGRWQAEFTSEQINGWLATQLAENETGDLPSGVSEPRVGITPDGITLGFRTKLGGAESVITVDAAPLLTESGDVAIHLKSVHAGTLPLPVLQVADEIAGVCQDLSLPVRWTRHEGLPVAIIDIHDPGGRHSPRIAIDTIELSDRSLFVAGQTQVDLARAPLAESQEPSAIGE